MFVVLKYVSEEVRAARARSSGLSSAARSLYARGSTHKLRVARDSGGGMVCLAIWLQMIATEPISKFIMIWLPIELFISSGFDHLVVNEFLIPGGIIVGGKFLDSRINWGNAFWFNFIPVTIGSIVGAWFLVIPFWFVNKDGFWKRQEREAAAKAAKEEKVVEA